MKLREKNTYLMSIIQIQNQNQKFYFQKVIKLKQNNYYYKIQGVS